MFKLRKANPISRRLVRGLLSQANTERTAAHAGLAIDDRIFQKSGPAGPHVQSEQTRYIFFGGGGLE